MSDSLNTISIVKAYSYRPTGDLVEVIHSADIKNPLDIPKSGISSVGLVRLLKTTTEIDPSKGLTPSVTLDRQVETQITVLLKK